MSSFPWPVSKEIWMHLNNEGIKTDVLDKGKINDIVIKNAELLRCGTLILDIP